MFVIFLKEVITGLIVIIIREMVIDKRNCLKETTNNTSKVTTWILKKEVNSKYIEKSKHIMNIVVMLILCYDNL